MSESARPTLNRQPDLTVIVVAHSEGRLLHHTTQSVEAALEHAHTQGCSTELLLVLADASGSTSRYAKEWSKAANLHHTIVTVHGSDQARAYNQAVKKAAGKFIALVPAGDLVMKEWFTAAINYLKKASNRSRVIAHPEYYFTFGGKDELQRVVSSNDSQFDGRVLLERDYFGGHAVASHELLSQYRFRASEYNGRLVGGTWLWSCDTLAEGIVHESVAQTMAACRFKSQKYHHAMLLNSSSYLSTSAEYPGTAELPHTPPSTTDRRLARVRKLVVGAHRSRPLQVLARRHRRLAPYLASVRNETLHLLRPVETAVRPELPDWLETTVGQLHQLDHRIFLSVPLKQAIEWYQPQPTGFSAVYWQLLAQLPKKIDTLLVVNYIKNGGAERELKNLIAEVHRHDPKRIIAVLATEQSDSPWINNLGHVHFVEAGELLSSLPPDQQGRLLASLCLQLRPRVLHVMNSVAGYHALSGYSEFIKDVSKIFITIFSVDRTPEGRKTHLFTEHMNEAIDNVSKVFTDNQTLVNELIQLMAVPKGIFSVHYQPAALERTAGPAAIAQKLVNKPVRIVWAGRLDRQKRPDVLIEVASLLSRKKIDVDVHVYGGSAFDNDTYQLQIAACQDLTYHGAYEGGLASLELETFDIFLMTSEWEGMPNVLLEAIIEGLLVIAPNVGGVSELIEDGITGRLVSDFTSDEEYVAAIEQILQDPEEARKMIKQAQELVRQRHSPEAYQKRVAAERLYFGDRQ